MTPIFTIGVILCVHAVMGGESMVNQYLAQGFQVAFVVLFAPLLHGIMERYRARLARRHGPPIWQSYRNLWKWWHKETVRSQESSWISEWTPIFYVIAPMLVAMLIPVLTTFPLPFAWMGDMLAGGMILSAGGFALLLAALDSGGTYPAVGVSRIRLIGTFTEPLAMLVVFGAASAAGATIPFVVNQSLQSTQWFITPTHVLLVVGWFLLLIAESGRIPVDNPSSSQELSMIDPGRTLESSGPDLALYEWGGWMKFVVLNVILLNVLTTPWGLAQSLAWGDVASAVVLVAVKIIFVSLILVSIEAGFAKLRLVRNVDFLMAAILLSALAGLATGLVL